MNLSTLVLGLSLAASLLLNAYLYRQLRLFKARPKNYSIELQDFINDVRNGVGILAVARVDPEQILLRSPRQER